MSHAVCTGLPASGSVLDPPIVAKLRHFAGVERAEDRGVERAEVFLLELRAADVLAVERDVFRQALVNLLGVSAPVS
jgi:hypothetical protein